MGHRKFIIIVSFFAVLAMMSACSESSEPMPGEADGSSEQGAPVDSEVIGPGGLKKVIPSGIVNPVLPEKAVTFQRVQPIFEKRCVGCHSGLDMGSGSQDFAVYSSAFAHKEQILERVVILKNMPLYSTMPIEERELIRDWVNQGGLE